MKRKNITKILAVILIILLLMTQITACNKRRGVEKTVPEHVYRRTEIALPEKIQYVSNMFLEGERIYVLGVGYNETDYTEYYILYSMNQDGSDPVEKKMDVSFSKIDGYDGSYLSYITALSDQRLLAVVDAWAEDKEKGEYKSDNFFIILDKDGKVQKKINLNELLKNHITTDYFYAGMLLSDSAGNIYISSDRTIYVLKSDFTFAFKVELTGNSWMQSMFNYSKDRIAVVMSTEGEEGYKMQIRIIDPEKKAFSEEINVNTHLQNNLYQLFTGLDYSLYYSTQSGIYGYDVKSGESRELLNWINSDIENPNLGRMTAVSDKRFVCIAQEYDESTWTSKQSVMILDYIPPEEVVPKYVITLATAFGAYDVRKPVIEFNRNSQEYRIQIKDYYQDHQDYEDYTEVIDKLNNDIIAGNMPDILLVDINMPFESYVSKGLLYDMYKLLNKDESFNKEDYFTNVLDAMSVNGKLYSISPSFSVSTVAIKSKFVDTNKKGWTMGELQALMAKLPKETETFIGTNRQEMMDMALSITLGRFIDKDSGKCYFDSQDFIDILKFTKGFNEKSFWEDLDYNNLPADFWEKYDRSYEEDRAILNLVYLNSFYQYTQLRDYTFKEDITLIGFPNSDRNGSAIGVENRIAISSKSKLIDGCWEFVKSFLSDKYQESITYQWPVKISAFDKMAEKAMKGEDGYGPIEPLIGDVVYDSIGMPNPMPQEGRKISEDDVKYIKSFLQSVDVLMSYEQGVMDIINEEAKMYYAGNKTAEETAKIIQSRVQIYVSEGR